MPRYFIDTDDGSTRVRDEGGLDLPDAAAARAEAIRALPDMARDTMPNGDRRTLVSEVRDERGTVVYHATLTFAGRWGG